MQNILPSIVRMENDISNLKMQAEKNISNSEAAKILREAIFNLKKESNQRINIITLHQATGLSFERINKIMDEFEKKGLVKCTR